jgi:hypothetical protein
MPGRRSASWDTFDINSRGDMLLQAFCGVFLDRERRNERELSIAQ